MTEYYINPACLSGRGHWYFPDTKYSNLYSKNTNHTHTHYIFRHTIITVLNESWHLFIYLFVINAHYPFIFFTELSVCSSVITKKSPVVFSLSTLQPLTSLYNLSEMQTIFFSSFSHVLVFSLKYLPNTRFPKLRTYFTSSRPTS